MEKKVEKLVNAYKAKQNAHKKAAPKKAAPKKVLSEKAEKKVKKEGKKPKNSDSDMEKTLEK